MSRNSVVAKNQTRATAFLRASGGLLALWGHPPATKSLRAPVGLQLFLFALLLGCGKAVPKPPVLPPHDFTMMAGDYGNTGKGVTIENFSGDGHMSKGLFTVDSGPASSPVPPSHEAAVYADIMQSLKQTLEDTRANAATNKKYLKLIVDQADWFHDCVRQTTQEFDRLHCDSRGNELYKRNKTLQGRP